MTRAYDEVLLERASDSLGRMLDFSVHSLRQDAASMMELFCACGLASLFERGDIRTIAGMSGIELAYETLERSGLTYERATPRHTRSLSGEYWCGRVLVRAQWASCLPFRVILKSFSIAGFTAEFARERTAFLDSLPLDISEPERAARSAGFGRQFADEAADALISAIKGASKSIQNGATKGALNSAGPEGAADTPLKIMRKKNGLSQSQLAKACGIPLRTIQQYEQRQKDLSRARAEYLIALSRVLNCDPSQLIICC